MIKKNIKFEKLPPKGLYIKQKLQTFTRHGGAFRKIFLKKYFEDHSNKRNQIYVKVFEAFDTKKKL